MNLKYRHLKQYKNYLSGIEMKAAKNILFFLIWMGIWSNICSV